MLLGIDIGLTSSKAVVFDNAGVVISTAARPTRNVAPRPGWSERQPDEFWLDLAGIIRDAVAAHADQIEGVAVAAHGDGLWLVDDKLRAVRPGITSLDARAGFQANLIQRELGVSGLVRLGKLPWASHPSALLRWLQEHEPAVVQRAAWAFSAKDFIRSCLTGVPASDLTDAGAAFTDIARQTVSTEVLELQGLGGLDRLVPPVLLPDEIAGVVTAAAAAATGLREGTPVVAGLHDTAAAALGCGAASPGDVSLLSGTFSVNQQVVDSPDTSPDWVLNSFVHRGQWVRDSSSPASTANLDWFIREICPDIEPAVRRSTGTLLTHFGLTEPDATTRANRPYFLPQMNGSLNDSRHSGGFIGLRTSHTRADMLFSVVESLAFNHRLHLSLMGISAGQDEPPLVHVAGGISRSAWWRQMLADVLAVPVSTPRLAENGALGAAIVAGSGVGVFGSIDEGVTRTATPGRALPPSSERSVAFFEHRYQRYLELIEALNGWWSGGQAYP
ncbi:FGGY-family carbohydrate kinase [Microbacterium sp. X-17]|uniref:FGGY-family carbohydrate kinase n=1 Tax=Microbacterium sp. X-17 TaxID=3144404 RepID=UPI0031F4F03E